MLPYIALYGLCCLVSFVLFGIDKDRSRRKAWRVSERKLLTAAALGGAGALLGMSVFRHKTRHILFRILVPLFTILQIAAFIYYAPLMQGGN